MDAFEAIGEANRRRIVELVSTAELSAGEIAGHFTISRPAVSQHLSILVDAGVLQVRADGRRRVYSLEPDALAPVENWLDDQRRRWARALDSLERAMEDDT